MPEGKTFSETWYRVANLRVGLRPTVSVRRQFFRGEKWHVLHDPFNNQFFRLRPEAYEFVARLSPDRTVEDAWTDCLNRFPDTAPGQEEVVQLLSQLYQSNLLFFSSSPDSLSIFERHAKRKRREVQSKLMSIMFMRLPLFDPDRVLSALKPFWRIIVGPLGALLWIGVVATALKLLVDNWNLVLERSQSVLAPGNLLLLYLALIIIKTLHEFGHAAVCKRFGGEVHTMGVMLLVFTLLPYMDATSSWAFRNRWKRVLVGVSGILVELFLASIAVFVWVRTSPGILHSLAYNVMFIASISSLLFNANPLLRFDGYYILSDLVDVPNLHQRSRKQVRYLVERYALGCCDSESTANTRREAVGLVAFATASGIYRCIIFPGIILFVSDKFLLLGMLMAVTLTISWIIIPFGKLMVYLASSPKLNRNRGRAWAVCGGALTVVMVLLLVVPFPQSFKATGIVESTAFKYVFTSDPGRVAEIYAESGSQVQTGAPLLRLENTELQQELVATRAQLVETEALISQARQTAIADMEPLQKRLATVAAKIEDLQARVANLTVHAEADGIWHAPRQKELIGVWVKRGAKIGQIIDPSDLRFTAAVTQNEASRLFQKEIERIGIRIRGQAETEIPVKNCQIIPYEQTRLPSAVLGWLGGGDIAVASGDETGTLAKDPFFLIHADINASKPTSIRHGQSGKIRFKLPATPIANQLFRKLRQIFQGRYRL